MHRRYVSLFCVIVGCLFAGKAAFAQTPALDFRGSQLIEKIPSLANGKSVRLTSGSLYAVFHTSEGDIITKLFPDKAPQTVGNFVELTTGKKAWRHPLSLRETTQSVFSNTMIYRTIPNSMIFGGDPLNTGEADSGGNLEIEARSGLAFDQAGYLAMDNKGTIASSSRWFMTLRPFPERSGKYSIFGKVIGGLDIVQRISLKPTKRPQLPLDPVQLGWVEIIRIPAGRMTTGKYESENGVSVLRINPRFVDMPEGELADEEESTTGSLSTSATAEETSPTQKVPESPTATPVVQYL